MKLWLVFLAISQKSIKKYSSSENAPSWALDLGEKNRLPANHSHPLIQSFLSPLSHSHLSPLSRTWLLYSLSLCVSLSPTKALMWRWWHVTIRVADADGNGRTTTTTTARRRETYRREAADGASGGHAIAVDNKEVKVIYRKNHRVITLQCLRLSKKARSNHWRGGGSQI